MASADDSSASNDSIDPTGVDAPTPTTIPSVLPVSSPPTAPTVPAVPDVPTAPISSTTVPSTSFVAVDPAVPIPSVTHVVPSAPVIPTPPIPSTIPSTPPVATTPTPHTIPSTPTVPTPITATAIPTAPAVATTPTPSIASSTPVVPATAIAPPIPTPPIAPTTPIAPPIPTAPTVPTVPPTPTIPTPPAILTTPILPTHVDPQKLPLPLTADGRLRVVMYSVMPYEHKAFNAELDSTPKIVNFLDIVPLSARLTHSTVPLAAGAGAITIFATDDSAHDVIDALALQGVRLIALRYSGCCNVDVEKAAQCGITVVRIPAHASRSIAEYTITLLLTLTRKVHIAYNRVRGGNLSLNGLDGWDLAGRTIGLIGTGQVGLAFARILTGFSCRVFVYDVTERKTIIETGATYVSLRKLLQESDVITLHAPLVPGTHHMINSNALQLMKPGVLIINTSRGGLIDVKELVTALQTGRVGGVAMDVYEGERSLFFTDRSPTIDWTFEFLKSMPNVIITSHQASLTTDALSFIAKETIKSLVLFRSGGELVNAVKPEESKEKDA